MGILDKLADLFFFRSKKSVQIKGKARISPSTIISPFYIEGGDDEEDILNPHKIYSPKKQSSEYYFDTDVLREDRIETFNPQYDSSIHPTSQDKILEEQEKPKTYNTSINLQTVYTNNVSDKLQTLETPSKPEEEKKKIFLVKFKKQPFSKYVCRKIDTNYQNASLPSIVLVREKKVFCLKNVSVTKNHLLVEEGEFIANLNFHLSRKHENCAIAMYKGKEIALTSHKNYVFSAKEELLDKDFLDLLIQHNEFDEKLRFLAWKKCPNKTCIPWEVLINGLWMNMPPLGWQKNVVNRKKAIEEIIRVKKSICVELDKWMNIYFHSLFDNETTIIKSFQELFDTGGEKINRKANFKLHKLEQQYGKFIFSNIKGLIIEGCKFNKLNRLILSKKIYGEENQQHLINLWLGSEEFSSFSGLITIKPQELLGIPYSYHLFRENLNNLIQKLPSITTKRSISVSELKNYEFEIHSQEKIDVFNETCQPVFEYQQLIEEEIYKLTKLQQEDLQISCLRVLSNKLSD